MKKPSLQQIADELGISRITVSKVIHHHPGVSDETRRRVAQKLVESGYQKIDRAVYELAQGFGAFPDQPKNIAVIATEPDFSDFWLKMINGIASEITAQGYSFIYNFITRDEELHFVLPQNVLSRSVCGMIVINVYDDDAIHMLSDVGLPVVFYDVSPRIYREGVRGDLVLLEGYRVIYQITESILKKGRRKIGFVGDITYSQTIHDRYRGFRAACKDLDGEILPEYCLLKCEEGHFYFEEEVKKFATELKELPEAFVCANDITAYILIGVLAQRGVRVPEDVAVSGYDNIKASLTGSKLLDLTTASVDTGMLGRRLAKQLLLHLEDPPFSQELVYVKPNVFFRKSTDF